MPSLAVETRRFALRETFTISRGSRTHVTVVEARLTVDGVTGRGECVPYPRYDETPEGVTANIEAMRVALEGGLDREALQEAMPAGAARNALDLAFWDLEAKQTGQRVWELPAYAALGGAAPGPVPSCYTLSIDTPEKMRAAAEKNADRPLLKIKLGAGPEDMDRMAAVRAGAPNTRLVIDANEGWSTADYEAHVPTLQSLGVELIEQPVHENDDAALAGIAHPVPLCADESCHTRASLDRLQGRYEIINIKLDKTGGLTEALALRAEAQKRGFGVMVGCMMSSSLGVAPAVLVAGGVQIADLDPPMLLGEDRDPPLGVDASAVSPPEPELWG
ncbi:MAG: N-acetyl-D-Glu racemase DgcA [Pseudomonadota bacterium]